MFWEKNENPSVKFFTLPINSFYQTKQNFKSSILDKISI